MRKKIISLSRDDFRWDYYRGTGAGGQKRNKTSNCVRCTHEPSGSVGKSEEGRSQLVNRKKAFSRCVATKAFRVWLRVQVAKKMGQHSTTEAEVAKSMQARNIVTEVYVNGKWELEQ